MDPIELLKLCHKASEEGIPNDVIVPRLFSAGEFEATWHVDRVLVRKILDETLCAPHPDSGLEMLLRSGALHALIPELVAIKNLGDDPAAALHKDVWEHTKKVVAGVPNVLELRWGALMHDIGKARTRRVDNRGKVTFHNHDIVGERMVVGIERRLGLFNNDPSLLACVKALVLNHLRPAGYNASWTDSGVRRLMTDVGGPTGFQRLMTLSRADLTTKNANKRDKALARGRELEARVNQVYAADCAPKLPKGTMGMILQHTATSPGAWINVLRERLEESMRIGTLPTDASVEFYVAEGLRLIQEAEKGV